MQTLLSPLTSNTRFFKIVKCPVGFVTKLKSMKMSALIFRWFSLHYQTHDRPSKSILENKRHLMIATIRPFSYSEHRPVYLFFKNRPDISQFLSQLTFLSIVDPQILRLSNIVKCLVGLHKMQTCSPITRSLFKCYRWLDEAVAAAARIVVCGRKLILSCLLQESLVERSGLNQLQPLGSGLISRR